VAQSAASPIAPRAASPTPSPAPQTAEETEPDFDDVHVHLTNYIQKGPDARTFLKVMGNKVHRATLFGIPLQQTWAHHISGDFAPTYYLESDAPLYYYSFTDALIANEYKSLTQAEQARFDPMITGFNPADMYAVDHIRRVLQTYPGVFSGIGEFTIHKEFVAAKVAGEKASLLDPALDRILDFAGETGLVALIHNDMDVPFAKHGDAPVYAQTFEEEPLKSNSSLPVYYNQMKALLKRHPKTTLIWAHTGLGRVVRPFGAHAELIEEILKDPTFKNVYFDISWDEVAKYIVSTPESLKKSADLFNRYPDRFLFGTDEVAPTDPAKYFKIYYQYGPLWKLLTPEASLKIRRTNYERIFDEARRKVRAWEKVHIQPK
jgi:predicted TIM-barrel fold metal-dependent hydrolase